MIGYYIKFLLLFSTGLIFTVYGLKKFMLFRKINRLGKVATVTVINHQIIVDHDPDFTQKYFKPVFRFKNEKGEVVTGTNELQAFNKLDKEEIEINYLRINGKYVLIINDSLWKVYLPLLYFSLGIVLLALSIMVIT